MTDLAKLVVRLEAQTAQYMSELEKANKRLTRFDKEASVSASRIAKGVAAAVVAAAAGFAAMTKSAIDSADQLGKMAQSTGISTEALSQLEYAAQLSDVSLDQLSTNLRKLQKTQYDAAKGSKAQADAFKALGVSATNADGSLRDTEEVLLDVADRFSKLEDGAGKAAIAQELFGRSGGAMIPFLNQGRDGIEALRKEADLFGLTVSGRSSAAAEQFNDNLTRVAGIARGLANQAAEHLLPVLVALSERFIEGAKSGGSMETAVVLLAESLKVLVSSGVIVKSIFQQLGRVIYGVGAAMSAVVQADFSLAVLELEDTFRDTTDNVKADAETIAKIWDETMPAAIASAVTQIDDELEDSLLFNDQKAEDAAAKAAESALKSLKDIDMGLREQVATWGMAEDAVIQYRLAHGDLAEDIRTAGPEAEAYAESIRKQAEALQHLRDQEVAEKEITDLMNEEKAEALRVTESVKTATEEYADEVERLTHLLGRGAITQETFDRAVKAAEEQMEKAEKAQNKFLEKANENVQDILATGIDTAIRDGVEEGAKGALEAFKDMITKMATQALAARLAEKIFGGDGMGGEGGSGGGGWLGTAMNFISGMFSRDSGGRGSPGTAYMIGTGAQPEMFVPDQPGTFVPAGAMAGGGVTQNIYVQGQVNQRSARQLELEASRRQRVATMRLG